MASSDINKQDFIPKNLKAIVVPISLLFLGVFLFLIVFKVGISRINTQKANLQKSERDETILTQKQEILQSLEAEVLGYADSVSTAMPDKNPSLIAISQIKQLAETNAISLADIEVGNPTKDKKGLSRVVLSFEVEGALPQVLSYLAAMDNFAPLSTVDKVEITQAAGTSRATIDLAVYWAPLPTKLPAISEPVREFTANEAALITELSELQQPIFTEVKPSLPSGRIDPFTFQ